MTRRPEGVMTIRFHRQTPLVMTIRFHLQTPSGTTIQFHRQTPSATMTTTTTALSMMATSKSKTATSTTALSMTDNIIPRQLAIPQLLTVILSMVPMHRQRSYINNVLPKSIPEV